MAYEALYWNLVDWFLFKTLFSKWYDGEFDKGMPKFGWNENYSGK